MARRRGFFAKFADAISDAFDRLAGKEPRRRRARQRKETRRFARGQQTSGRAAERYARERRDAEETRRANRERRAREARQADPFRREWGQRRGRGRSYARHWRLFNEIPGIAEEDERTKMQLWYSYIENMVDGSQERNDPGNPFWSDVGMSPRDFAWDDWRGAMGYRARTVR